MTAVKEANLMLYDCPTVTFPTRINPLEPEFSFKF